MVAKPMSEPVVSGCRLSLDQRERLGEAERLASGTLAERRQAVAMVRAVEGELASARDAVETDAAIARALARARRHGEAFEVETVDVGEWRRAEDGSLARRNGQLVLDVQTVRRASRIDGLANLFKAGALTDDEKRVGDEVRALFARATPPMSVSAYGSTQAGFADVGRMAVSVAEAGSALRDIGRVRAVIDDERTFAVVEAVAGRGATIRSLGDGALKAINLDRLKVGLATAKGVLKALKVEAKAKSACHDVPLRAGDPHR